MINLRSAIKRLPLVLLLGLAVTLTVVLAQMLGAFETLERWSIDFRFTSTPRPAQPMSPEMVHVDVDDGAIDRIGRWPWDRLVLADVIDELHGLGAKTIAIDMLLMDEQQYPEGTSKTIDHDQRLADALGRANCVLPVVIYEGPLYDERWLDGQGRAELLNLLEELGQNIRLDNEEALERISGDRRALFLQRPLEFKLAAAWQAIERADKEPDTFADFEQLVGVREDDAGGFYAEEPTLRSVWRKHEAWMRMRPLMLPELEQASRGSFRDLPPLPRFVDKARLVGYVNAGGQLHPDGAIREFSATLEAAGGFVVPMGVAAAALHLGWGPNEIFIEGDTLLIGMQPQQVALPLRNGKLWINWPPSDTEPAWQGLLRQSPNDDKTAGHLSIEPFVRLARSRRTLEENRENLPYYTGLLLHLKTHAERVDGGSAEDNLATTRDEASFTLMLDEGDLPTRAAIEAARLAVIDEPEQLPYLLDMKLRNVERCARWLELDALSEANREPFRDEFEQLTRDILLYQGGLTFAPLGDDELPAAIEEARSMLEDLPAFDELKRIARVWSSTDLSLREDPDRIAAEETDLRNLVENKLVFMGYTASGAVAEFVRTPIDAGTPGVVVHAAVANMVLSNRPVRFPASWIVPVITLLLGLLCTLAASRLPVLYSVLLAGGVFAAYVGVAGLWLFGSRHVVMPMVAPLTAGFSAWVACTAMQAATTQRERRRITMQFKARVSSQLVDHLTRNPEAVTLGGEEREVSVLFADLAGFTSVSESLGGPTSVATLNRYMSSLTAILVRQDAYVNKFLGDGVMAFWSALVPDPQQAKKACQAALNCQTAMEQLNEDPNFAHIPSLGLRLGIATGRAVVGDCGAPPALSDYTVIGDTVNLAARLESANKQFDTQILINDRTKELLDGSDLLVRPIGRIVVVGQTQPVLVFEVMPPDAPPELIEISGRLVKAYMNAAFDEALRILDEMAETYGASELVNVYRNAIENRGAVFDGTLRLESK